MVDVRSPKEFTDQNYIGKVVYDIPKLGVVTKVISPPTNYIIIGVLIIVLIYYSRFGRREEQKRLR